MEVPWETPEAEACGKYLPPFPMSKVLPYQDILTLGNLGIARSCISLYGPATPRTFYVLQQRHDQQTATC